MQSFQIRVIDEFILLGNSAIMRCLLPSFVADFVQVSSWLIIDDDESTEINVSQANYGNKVELSGVIRTPLLILYFTSKLSKYFIGLHLLQLSFSLIFSYFVQS